MWKIAYVGVYQLSNWKMDGETLKICRAYYRPIGFLEVEPSRFLNNQHRVVSPRQRPSLSQGNIPGTHFCQWLGIPQNHNVAGSFMSMKNSSDIIGNRNRDLPACSAVLFVGYELKTYMYFMCKLNCVWFVNASWKIVVSWTLVHQMTITL